MNLKMLAVLQQQLVDSIDGKIMHRTDTKCTAFIADTMMVAILMTQGTLKLGPIDFSVGSEVLPPPTQLQCPHVLL